jgi:hypothetical protein
MSELLITLMPFVAASELSFFLFAARIILKKPDTSE